MATKKSENIFTDVKDNTKGYTKKEIADGKAMSILAYISILALIPYFCEKDNKYVRFHAIQGMNLFLSSVIYGVALWLVSFILMFIPIIGWLAIAVLEIAALGFLALAIIGIVNVCDNKAKELPIINKIQIIKK